MEEKFMRVLVMFDMPTCSKKERKDYARFRKNLIKDGFMMLQYSVYMRICKG
ncbi:CRISPR-associated endonuclease Cas2, partial [Helicobacter typhlonius]